MSEIELLRKENKYLKDHIVIKNGQWVNDENSCPVCDLCGYVPMYDHCIDDIYYSPFCPNCGADMRDE